MAYKKKTRKELQQEVTTLIDGGLTAIKKHSRTLVDQLELLDFMSDFYHYSVRNQGLILSQFDGAYAVGSFKFFKDKGFSVRKGEKSIRILRPNIYKVFRDEKNVTKLVKEATPDEQKKIENKVLKSWEMKTYSPTGVFDITQTNAKPEDYPKIFPNRRVAFTTDDPENLNRLEMGLTDIAKKLGIPIHTEETSIFGLKELGAAKGVFAQDNLGRKEIVLNSRNNAEERIHTLIHELAHGSLHDPDRAIEGYWSTKDVRQGNPSLKEFQAEMVSYVVSKRYGIDTSEETIPYLASWTKNLSRVENESEEGQFLLLEDIQRTSKSFIETIEDTYTRFREKEQTQQEVIQAFTENYQLEGDQAFSLKDIEKLYERSKELSENQTLAAIDLHRRETIVDWEYTGSKKTEEISQYQEELALNLKKKVMDGHLFYQVGESVEILLAPGTSEGKEGTDFFILDNVGDLTTYSIGNQEEVSQKLQELNAFPVSSLSALKEYFSSENARKRQKELVHNQVMRNTYLDETGRSMT